MTEITSSKEIIPLNKNVVILGAGSVGFALSDRLVKDEYNVSVIDTKEDVLKKVESLLDVNIILGNGSDPEILKQAGICNADTFLAVTEKDEINMVACQVAHSIFGIKLKLARIKNKNYIKQADKLFGNINLPIDFVISPEEEVAKTILNRLHFKAAKDIMFLYKEELGIVAVSLANNSPFLGLKISDIKDTLYGEIEASLVATMHNEVYTIPDKNHIFVNGDLLYFSATKRGMIDILELHHQDKKQDGNFITIAGGGDTGAFVASKLLELGMNVKIIERSSIQAKKISQELDGARVICGDATDKVILEEELIAKTSTFMALMDDDEANILSSLLVKKYGVENIITVVNSEVYTGILKTVGVENVISPKLLLTASILSKIKANKFSKVTSIAENIEVLSILVNKDSVVLKKKLKDIDFKKATIGAILRGGSITFPNQNTELFISDTVFVITEISNEAHIEKLFSSKKSVFNKILG